MTKSNKTVMKHKTVTKIKAIYNIIKKHNINEPYHFVFTSQVKWIDIVLNLFLRGEFHKWIRVDHLFNFKPLNILECTKI